ncbi:uncharacterized protein LOC143233586 isoform X2 [Tachypleus tridentatus]|uniref:uncharacterized protein LOC143233586 isoform X2 n=1 Tax=Tachypleus tridentatus TaxID=6853 RepID=UPI003FD526FF
MSFVPNVVTKKRRKSDNKPQSQLNKCLNEKRRREQENTYIEELAELISARFTDMSSLSVKPDKCAILQETVNQINRIKHQGQTDALQQSEVSSSNSTILSSNILGPLLLEALDGFLLVINVDGKIVVSENVFSFLKYTKDDLVGKSIYSIIHVRDHAFFSNILLSMSLGWASESSTGTSKSRLFSCHFKVKVEEDLDMDGKKPQYEKMQVSTVLLPYPPVEGSPNFSEGSSESQNCLFCVTRRIPQTEKSINRVGIELFTTRLDKTGKITVIDTSGVSSTYSQHLNKDLVGKSIQELCHPKDRHKVNQHLKDTLQTGSNTSGIYCLQISQDKYICVQTKSKKFSYSQVTSEEEFIMSTHSIIRDSETPQSLESLQKSSTPAVSGNLPSTSLIGNLNEGLNGVNSAENVSVNMSTSVYGGFSTFSPSSHDFGFNDLGMDMFAGPTWDLIVGNHREDGLAITGTTSYTSTLSPHTQMSTSPNSINNSGSVHSVVQGSHSSNSAFSPELTQGKISPVTYSPAAQFTSVPSPTSCGNAPFSASFSFSSIQSSPTCGKMESTGTIVDRNSTSPPTLQENQSLSKTAQKLRNLLTKTTDKVNSLHTISTTVSKEYNVTSEVPTSSNSGLVLQTTQQSLSENGRINSSSNKENILCELLNKEVEEASAQPEGASKIAHKKELLKEKSSEDLKSKPDGERPMKNMNTNNMLRKLLNDDDDDENSYRKSHLLKPKHKDQNQNENSQSIGEVNSEPTNESTTGDQFLNQLGIDSSSQPGSSLGPSNLDDIISVTAKRKSSDSLSDSSTETPQKRSNHAYLAGQNPMLVSMLAQTPKTEPSIPTTIASSIMSQLPQDRLPRGLEKKLLNTSAKSNIHLASSTVASTMSTPAATLESCTTLSTTTIRNLLRQDVTFDSWSQPTFNQHQLSNTSIPQQHQQLSQQELLLKIFNNPDASQLSKSLGIHVTTNNGTASSSNFFPTSGQISIPSPSHMTLSELLGDAISAETTGTIASNDHVSDPLLSQILEEVWSLEQEMESPSAGDSVVVKLLDEAFSQTSVTSTTTVQLAPQSMMSTQDLQAKMAINAIQKQLMSYETPSSGSTPVSSSSHVVATPALYPQLTTTTSPSAITTSVSTSGSQSLSQPPTYNSVIVSQRSIVPSLGAVTNGQQVLEMLSVQRAGLSQYPGAGNIPSNLAPQMKSRLYERRQKYLLQQQKRLLAQQQQQQLTLQTHQPVNDQLTLSSAPPFHKNMNDLLNNTVAPNVTLQRSSSKPEHLSPRYSTNLVGQISSQVGQTVQSQLSPGQRGDQQSPYSPLSQPPYPSSTSPASSYQQQQRLSPHPMPTYPSSGSGSPRSPHLKAVSPQPGINQTQWTQHPAVSLQKQNPMLNAQLSQSSYGGQNKFVGQQQRQIHIQSMPSSSSGGWVNSPCTPQQVHAAEEQHLSPQPQISPNFSSHSLPGNQVSNSVSATNTIASTTSVSYSATVDNSNYFDQPSLQLFTNSAECRSGLASTAGMTSEFVRQELRAKVGARTQQQQGVRSQQQLQFSMSGTNSPSEPDVGTLGLSLELGEGNQRVLSGLFSQSVLDASTNPVSPMSAEGNNSRVEEPKPPEQKKSLLQQLLSAEPP